MRGVTGPSELTATIKKKPEKPSAATPTIDVELIGMGGEEESVEAAGVDLYQLLILS